MSRIPKRIKVTLNNIDKAIRELEEYRAWFIEKTRELTEALALVGAKEAAHWFGTAIYDGDNDVSVEVVAKDDGSGWIIRASGQAVAFIEFGTGRYYNPNEPYPAPRPAGIVGIGEYGHKQGRKQGWVYREADGAKTFTRGNPPAMAMYRANEKMKDDIIEIAREVFSRR